MMSVVSRWLLIGLSAWTLCEPATAAGIGKESPGGPSGGFGAGVLSDRPGASPGTVQINGMDVMTGLPGSMARPAFPAPSPGLLGVEPGRSRNAPPSPAPAADCANLRAASGKARTSTSGNGSGC